MRVGMVNSIRLAAAVAALCTAAGQARADYVIPSTPIGSTDPVGASFTLSGGPYDANSVITATGLGIVNLNVPNGPFHVNAAGVVIDSAGAYSNAPGSVFLPGGPIAGIPFGALVIGNSTLGFFQLFPDNAANGFGSPTPPSSVSTSATLGSIFGAGVSLPDGTQLFVKINDTPLYDNAGSFTISGTITTASVPEPASLALMGLGSTLLIGLRFRRRMAV